MPRRFIVSDDDEDHPDAIDLASSAGLAQPKPCDKARSLDVKPCRCIFPLISEVIIIGDDADLLLPPDVEHLPSPPPAADADLDRHSTASSVCEVREAHHGDSTSSGSSESSGSDLSGDFLVHDEPAVRRKDRKILELFFPLTTKRLRMARIAPNLGASRPHHDSRATARAGFVDVD
jgi:hypothetical protein